MSTVAAKTFVRELDARLASYEEEARQELRAFFESNHGDEVASYAFEMQYEPLSRPFPAFGYPHDENGAPVGEVVAPLRRRLFTAKEIEDALEAGVEILEVPVPALIAFFCRVWRDAGGRSFRVPSTLRAHDGGDDVALTRVTSE